MKKNMDIGVKIVTIAIILNVVLLILKGVVGLATNSTALQADAVNSAGDTISSLAILFGIKYSLKPSDEDHHYGYGKMEALISLFVGVVILASTGFLWSTIVKTISTGMYYPASFWALLAALIALVVKIFLYISTMRIGKKINSIAVQTNAQDHRNDIVATIGTVIAIALSLLGSKTGITIFKYAESVAAAITSIFIIKAGIDIILSSAKMLMDAAPDDLTIERLEDTASKCTGVQELDWLKCRTVGRGILVDLAVEVDADLSIKEGHELGLNIKKTIHNKFKTVLEVQVHVNPDED